MLCFHDTNQKILKKGILFLNVVKFKTDKRKKSCFGIIGF